jgi:hypothetical protein
MKIKCKPRTLPWLEKLKLAVCCNFGSDWSNWVIKGERHYYFVKIEDKNLQVFNIHEHQALHLLKNNPECWKFAKENWGWQDKDLLYCYCTEEDHENWDPNVENIIVV